MVTGIDNKYSYLNFVIYVSLFLIKIIVISCISTAMGQLDHSLLGISNYHPFQAKSLLSEHNAGKHIQSRPGVDHNHLRNTLHVYVDYNL